MGSIIFNIACPQCGRVAVEDFYYKSDERYIYCQCCGYNFSQREKYDRKDGTCYLEKKENRGYGIFVLAKKRGYGKVMYLNSPVTDDDVAKFKEQYKGKDVDTEESCLVLYQNGIFNIVFGNVPKNFDLSFEEYKNKYNYDPFKALLQDEPWED